MTLPAQLQRDVFDMLMLSQHWAPARLRDFQRSQLDSLVRHARASTRLYRERLDVLFRPDGTIDWERWGEVPILKRAEITAHPEDVLADRLPPGHGPVGEATTSGSTGYPLTVRYTRLSALVTQAAKWRADSWHGLDWSKTLYIRHGYDAAAAWPHGVATGPWGPPWHDGARHGQSFRLNRHATTEEQLEFALRIGATYLATGGPKQAHAMALAAEQAGSTANFEAVLTAGEDITELDRAACRRVFGAEMFDVYSSKEGNHLAHRCPSQRCWHVNAETVLLEIVDANDRPCRPGEIGRVIITPFYSTAQPLIRYDQGDLAVLGERCACGRTLPALTQLLGRVVDLFRHPDGRTIARFFGEDNRALLQAGPWQIAQTGPLAFEVRYVPLDWAMHGDEAAAATAFRRIYFADAEVKFVRLPAISPMASGKYMEYVNEFHR